MISNQNAYNSHPTSKAILEEVIHSADCASGTKLIKAKISKIKNKLENKPQFLKVIKVFIGAAKVTVNGLL